MNYFPNKYFSEKELRCPLSSNLYLAGGFLVALIDLRIAYGSPVVPNSCCRSRVYNASKKIGGAVDSSHISEPDDPCCAIDWPISGGHNRRLLIKLALGRGWSVGVYKTFIHLDKRKGVAVLWRG